MAHDSAAGLLPAYLVVGADELKRHRVIERLKGHVTGDLAEFNLDEVEGSSIEDPAQLVTSLQTMPFGADVRVVVLHGAGSLAKAISEALVSYLKDPNPSCVLCLDAEKLAKNTRLYKAVAKIGSKAVIDCAPQKRWELPPYVQKLAAARGARISVDAADELVNRCGESTVMLDNQVATLVDLVAPRTDISLVDVEANVAQVAEVSPWAFADSVCERRAAKAMRLLRLMDNPSLVFLHTVLVGRLRELICARSLAARGASRSLASELGRAPWQVKNHMRWAQRFGVQELVELLREAAACERALKGSNDSSVAFERFVLAICCGPVASREHA